MEQRYKDMEVEEDIGFHRVQWVLQFIGRVLMFSFLIAAVLGLFGTGLFSKQTVKDGILQVTYERFGRLQKHTFFEIRIDSTQRLAGDANRKLWINNQFLKDIRMEYLDPEPSTVQADSKGHTFTFESSETGEASSIFFRFRPERPGKHTAVLRVDEDAGEVTLTQRIYP